MTNQQWAEVNRLFDEINDLPGAQRQPAIDAVADPLIRAELASLLQHAGPSADNLESAVGGVIRAAAEAGTFDPRALAPGTRFGHYKIERRLGHGGMGDVYEATRDDDFHQRVALKIVRTGMESEFALRRFQQERQFLASLEHPYIARLLDGGANEQGLPYLVLEFVEGTPVDTFSENLTRTEILRLFLKICEAVDYAHRRLIIHRDLKPANILVTADGMPKLLDFGIAKLADATNAADVTRTQFQAMTPQYASPEQIRNELVTTATDVYSLGLILYELLCRRSPYSIDSTTSLLEAHRIVTETEPAPPKIESDLDNILLMALRKDPARRYQSVRELADDIQRSLDQRPVLARPDTLTYRASKFLRRNRLAVAAAALLAIAITAGVSVSLYQASLARQRFEQVRRLARTFVFDIHDEIAKVDGTTAARELVVKTALEYLDQLNQSAGSDPSLREELAEAYVKVADAQGVPGAPNLGHLADASRNYAKASQLFHSLATDNPEKRPVLAHFLIAHARVKQYEGDTAGAIETAAKARAILEPLAQLPAIQADYASALSLLGEFQLDDTLLDKAAALIDQSPTRATRKLASQIHARRSAISLLGRLQDALQSLDKQEAILNELLTAEPTNPFLRRSRAVNYQDKSVLYYDDYAPSLNDPQNALVQARRYLEAASLAAAADRKNSAAQFSEAIAMSRVAVPERFSDPAASLAHARDALAALEALQAKRPSSFNAARIPRLRRILALSQLAAGNKSVALESARLAVKEQRALVTANAKDTSLGAYLAMNLHTLGVIEIAAGLTPVAIASLTEAKALIEPEATATKPALQFVNTLDKVLQSLALANPTAAPELHARAARLWAEYPIATEYVLQMRARKK